MVLCVLCVLCALCVLCVLCVHACVRCATPTDAAALHTYTNHQSRHKYKSEEVGLEQVDFYMVPDNTTKVKKRLDELRSKGPKFICLNDDMNKTHDPPAATIEALHNFYTGYVPLACPFELPEGETNKFLHMRDYRAAKANSFQERSAYYGSVALTVR